MEICWKCAQTTAKRHRCTIGKKNEETHYGYKNNAKVDADSKIITDYSAMAASVHDSQAIIDLLNESDRVIYADSAYSVAMKLFCEKMEGLRDRCVQLRVYRPQLERAGEFIGYFV